MRQKEYRFFQWQKMFGTEEACREHLFKIRWPNGFVCPKCGCVEYYYIKGRDKYQCKSCRHQSSVTSGTIMDKTHLPLAKWFWAIYFVAVDKRGYSALQLSRELDIGQKSAWYLLQRIRTAMMERDWLYKLSGYVETDEFYYGSGNNGGKPKKRGRGTTKAPIIASTSLDYNGNPGYAKMELVDNLEKDTFEAYAENNIEAGSTISSDGFASYSSLEKMGFIVEQENFDPIGNPMHLRWTHIIISNFKAFVIGTFHGLGKKHLQLYLAEFCWRLNRRFSPFEKFDKLVCACMNA
jgi:transposase-like protein